MTATLHLLDAVEDALAALPAAADEIAALFVDLNIKGRTGDACGCPVANYLGGEVKDSGAHIIVCADELTIGHDADLNAGCQRLEPPMHVTEFVNRFDNGDFPHLENVGCLPSSVRPATFEALVVSA